jgi:hypothetical protein
MFLKMKYAGVGDNKMVEERVPSYILRGISNTGCYTDIVLNKIFILVAEKSSHP